MKRKFSQKNRLAMQISDAKLLQYLPSMLWARTVRHRLGEISYGKIQKILEKDAGRANSEYWEKCSGRLYKNSNGKTRVEDDTFIDQVESLLPGTKRILYLPLWRILTNHTPTLDQLYSFMGDLPPDIQNKLFKVDKETRTIQRLKIKAITVDYLSKRSDLDALSCLLMMIREAEITTQIDAYIGCKWRAHQLFCRIATFQPLKSLAGVMYDLIFDKFIEKNDPLPAHLSHHLVVYAPGRYTSPSKYPMPRFLDENSELLILAIKNNIIGESVAEQLDFLFWIDLYFKRREIFQALEALSPLGTQPAKANLYPSPLNDLIKRMKGNSRSYLPKDQYII